MFVENFLGVAKLAQIDEQDVALTGQISLKRYACKLLELVIYEAHDSGHQLVPQFQAELFSSESNMLNS